MKIKLIILFIIILGFIAINKYINWLETKIVPFSAQIAVDKPNTYNFNLNNFYNGKHSLSIFFKEYDELKRSIRDIKKQLIIRCAIFQNSTGGKIFDNIYDINKLRITGWGASRIDGVDVDYSYYPEIVFKNDKPEFKNPSDDEKYIFHPVRFKNYKLQIQIINPDPGLSGFNPTIGFFCSDLDMGYFGIEYLIYNGIYIIFIICSFAVYFIIRFILRKSAKPGIEGIIDSRNPGVKIVR